MNAAAIDGLPFEAGVPGIYDLPAQLYHDQELCPGVSNSMLGHMEPPARLPVYLEEEHDPTAAMLLGTLVHARILEPTLPLPRLAVIPKTYGTDNKPWNFNATYCKEWRSTQQEQGKLVVKADLVDQLVGCVDAIRQDPVCQAIFAKGRGELSVFAEMQTLMGPVLTKRRVDWLPLNSNTIVDVKKVRVGFGGATAFGALAGERRYYCQAAFYLDGWNALMGQTDRRDCFVFVVVEEEPPFLVAKYEVKQEDIDAGRREYRLDLLAYQECIEKGEWRGFPTAIQPLQIPKYKFRKENPA